MNETTLFDRCAGIFPEPWRRVENRRLRVLAAALKGRLEREVPPPSISIDEAICLALCEYLDTKRDEIETLDRKHAEFSRRHAQASLHEERQFTLLEYAEALGASGAALELDRRAFDRWFGFDAMIDRYRRLRTDAERQIALALRCLGVIAGDVLRANAGMDARIRIWRRMDIESHIKPLLIFAGNDRLRVDAMRCLRQARLQAAADANSLSADEGTLQYIYRCALDAGQDVWLQCEALGLLQTMAPNSFREVIKLRLGQPRGGNDLFVRRHAVLLMVPRLGEDAGLSDLLPALTEDPSPYVRQAAASAMLQATKEVRDIAFPKLLADDPVYQVRASALLLLSELGVTSAGFEIALGWLVRRLASENDPFVLRVGLHVAATVAEAPGTDREHHRHWISTLQPIIDELHVSAPDLRVRRWAAMCRERLWILGEPVINRQAASLRDRLQACSPGGSIRLRRDELPLDADVAGRMLATLTQQDFGLDVEKKRGGWRLWRGHRFAFSTWRLMHELRHPSPDKRQAFRHTIGRIFHGKFHVPSGILAELAETKVPGEPLHYAQEDGWRPYLPLVDELISTLDQDFPIQPLRVYSAEGITEITPPASFFGRLRARFILTWRFAHYARLRNWNPDSCDDPAAYLCSLVELGFRVRLLTHKGEGENLPASDLDPATQRFFPLVGAISIDDLWQRLDHYFVSAFDNSLFELFVFVVVCACYFAGRHMFLNWRLRQARQALPLVIGGWGTRGKSGTERIKAALFNALGYSVVSKTTGCEAMFLHGHAFDELREMFLFRPYDKATIWEQYDVIRLAQKLECDVFLWECMALTPDFVRLLQRAWMRDDISTLTNTFPDHEDIQGPAGIDIPEVMTRFIPQGRIMVTSENQMLPILRHAAGKLGTRLRNVDWLQSGLLPPDVLGRFPYQEHPDNIALVLAVADELGIDEAFALKEMADRVVPDLGVLKTYPISLVDGRRLGFVNGMSANERFGCLGNWTRTGFDRVTVETDPGIMISTVVNNRADRVARSRVFASLLVADVSADRHFLIGSNLHGLQGYLRESWREWVGGVTLFTSTGDSTPADMLRHYARRFRVPTAASTVGARLRAMLGGVGLEVIAVADDALPSSERIGQMLAATGSVQAEGILRQYLADTAALAEFSAFDARLAVNLAAEERHALDADFRAQLWRWFELKIIVVEDFHASGDSVIATIAANTPPGLENRIMGIQNIKGTGLDFVYRWQAWDVCYQNCIDVLDHDFQVAAQGLQTLSQFQEYGLLSENMVRETMHAARQRLEFQEERFQAEIASVIRHLDAALIAIRGAMTVQRSAGWVEKVCNAIEGFIDAGDAIERRRTASQIYADLAAQRISHTRAVMELQRLNRIQKGGWLYPAFMKKINSLADLPWLPENK